MSDGNLLFKGKYTLDFGTEAVAEGKIQPVAPPRVLLLLPPHRLSLLSRLRMRLVSESASPSASATAAGPASQVGRFRSAISAAATTLILRCGS